MAIRVGGGTATFDHSGLCSCLLGDIIRITSYTALFAGGFTLFAVKEAPNLEIASAILAGVIVGGIVFIGMAALLSLYWIPPIWNRLNKLLR